jgi:GMC oxidoreductase
MTFTGSTYENFVSQEEPAQARLFTQYLGSRNDFDIVIVGSGIGGGILADDLADRLGDRKRILVLEAGSYLYPTHVFNCFRFPNAEVAQHFACKTFWQGGNESSQSYIHERPQLNFGGRSIFWSGLIPTIQPWELEFFPDRVRQDLTAGLLEEAGRTMNHSVSMGATAQAIVRKLRNSPLAADFQIEETPRALHQPYLRPDGMPATEFFVESTGVFNTAELLINQLGLAPGKSHGDFNGLFLLLNHYVEDVQSLPNNRFALVARNTLTGQSRVLEAGTVVLAGGSIESPKLLRRSSLFPSLPDQVKAKVGLGLTDHPTTDTIITTATNIGEVAIPRNVNAKIIFYSRGERENGQIKYPFNVEMNVNHEYWHLREDDPSAGVVPIVTNGASIIDIKFSFGNCLDGANMIHAAPPFGYVPEIVFRNQNWTDHLVGSRFPAVAGWQKTPDQVFALINEVTFRIFSQFERFGSPSRPNNEVWYGQDGMDFGYGTVHHAVGTLRMPYKTALDQPVQFDSVVDEDLQVIGAQNLYVCDMSVMPFSSAANPVRPLAGLALRMSRRFG